MVEKYNLLRAALLTSISFLTFLAPFSFAAPIPPATATVTPSSDVGSLYKNCFTAADSAAPNQTTTKCFHITVIGACTAATVDVNVDGLVNVQDLVLIGLHWGENQTVPEPYNPVNCTTIGLEDMSCVASRFGQTNPV